MSRYPFFHFKREVEWLQSTGTVFSELIHNVIQRGGAMSMSCDITNSSDANPGPIFSSVMWKLTANCSFTIRQMELV